VVEERKRYLTELLHTHYGDTTISNTTINATIDTLIQRIWAMAPGKTFYLKLQLNLKTVTSTAVVPGTYRADKQMSQWLADTLSSRATTAAGHSA